MKKFFTITATFAAVLMLAAFTQAKKPVLDPGTLNFEGSVNKVNVDVRGNINGSQSGIKYVAHNNGGGKNTDVVFDNMSGYTSGVIEFGNEGLYVTFGGPVNFQKPEMLKGDVPCQGAILVDGNLGYDSSTNTITGTDGSIIQFDGSMNIKAVIKSGGDRATMKNKISASRADLLVFENASTVSTSTVNVSVKFPAIQLKAANGNGNGNGN